MVLPSPVGESVAANLFYQPQRPAPLSPAARGVWLFILFPTRDKLVYVYFIFTAGLKHVLCFASMARFLKAQLFFFYEWSREMKALVVSRTC